MSERLFLALRMPEPILDELERSQARFRDIATESVFVPRQDLVLDLLTIDPLDDEGIAKVAGILETATRYASPVSLRLGELGCSPASDGLDAVAWRNVAMSGFLTNLFKTLCNFLEHASIDRPVEPFVPRVTLARKLVCNEGVDLHALLACPANFLPTKAHENGSVAPFDAEVIALLRSVQAEDGTAEVTELASSRLGWGLA